MSTQKVDLVPGTPITLGTNSNTVALTIKGLAAAAYRQSAKIDFGANYAQEWHVDLLTKFATTPTAGASLQLWIGYSGSGTAGTDNWGNCTGADAAYSGYGGGTAAQSILQLNFLGQLIVDSATNTLAIQGFVGSFVPKNRYGYVVILNNTSQGLTSTDADHQLGLRPVDARVEAAA